MSKKFLSGIDIVNGNLTIENISNSIGDIVTRNPSNGLITIRTASQILLDIGAVPYTGATQNVDLGEYGLEANHITLSITPTNVPEIKGTMFWDDDFDSVSIFLNGYKHVIGGSTFYNVKNQTGVLIPKGTNVQFAGTVGASARLLITPFIADGTIPSTFYMGVTAEDIADGEDGKVLWFGVLRDIDTSAFEPGPTTGILYASTTQAGAFQNTVPVAPNNIIQVAAVINQGVNNGSIFIRPSIGSNINNDEGVKITSGQTGDILLLQSNGLWENKTKADYLGGTSSQFVKGDGSLDSNTYDNYQNWLLEVSGVTGSYTVNSGDTIRLLPGSGINILRNDGDITIAKTSETAVRTEYTFIAVSSQTIFNISGGYLLNNIEVYVNGVKQSINDFTANDQLTVVLNTPSEEGDVIQVIVYLVDGVIPTEIGGNGLDKQVTFWTGPNTISGNNDFTWDNSDKNLSINGTVDIKSSTYDYAENNVTISGQNIISLLDRSKVCGVFFDYIAIKPGNGRTGTIMVITDGTNIEFTETSTNSIGDTSDVNLSVDISGNFIRLLSNSTQEWFIKTMIRTINCNLSDNNGDDDDTELFILVGGVFTGYNLQTYNYIIGLNYENAEPSTDFDILTGFNSFVRIIKKQSDDKVLVGGFFTEYQGITSNRLIRLNTDASIDNTFDIGTGSNGTISTIDLQSDNKILVGGAFTNFNGIVTNNIIRLNSDGTRDNSFVIGNGFNTQVLSIKVQSDNKILVGGAFTSYDGTTFNNIIRLNTDGSIDNTFNVGGGFNSTVNIIFIQPDNKILVGGVFTSYDGVTLNRIIRLNSDGSIDNTFNIGTGFNNVVETIELQPDNKILVGGRFTSYNGTSINRMIRLNTNGSIDNTFDVGTGFNDIVFDIKILPDNKIIVGGQFTTYQGVNANRIIKLNSNGNKDTVFNIGEGFNQTVWTVEPINLTITPATLTEFGISSSNNTESEACDLTSWSTLAYHDGNNIYPTIGDTIYTTSQGDIVLNGGDQWFAIGDKDDQFDMSSIVIQVNNSGTVISSQDCSLVDPDIEVAAVLLLDSDTDCSDDPASTFTNVVYIDATFGGFVENGSGQLVIENSSLFAQPDTPIYNPSDPNVTISSKSVTTQSPTILPSQGPAFTSFLVQQGSLLNPIGTEIISNFISVDNIVFNSCQ